MKIKLNLIEGPQARILKPSQDLKMTALFPKNAKPGPTLIQNCTVFLYVFLNELNFTVTVVNTKNSRVGKNSASGHRTMASKKLQPEKYIDAK